MVNQIEDGKIDTFECIANVWMKVTRGDIASRFESIKSTSWSCADWSHEGLTSASGRNAAFHQRDALAQVSSSTRAVDIATIQYQEGDIDFDTLITMLNSNVQ